MKIETKIISNIADINPTQWDLLIENSNTSTFFQTKECYLFYTKVKELSPFIFGVTEGELLKGIIVGYITKEKNIIKQKFTKRAIIIGGPLLDNNISTTALNILLQNTILSLKRKSIFIETRNFHSYQNYMETFIKNNFAYNDHLNFHLDTSSIETFEGNLHKSKKRHIRTSLRDGANIIQEPTTTQIIEYYSVLKELYTDKIKTPLFSLEFFLELNKIKNSHFLLIEKDGRIIGGIVCVGLHKNAIYEWFVCGLDNLCKNIHPSSLATYAGLKYAAENKYPMFDMMGAGKPTESYGVRDFKAQFGGKLVNHGRFIHINNKFLYFIGKKGVKYLKR